ncbi:MAG: M16 family metallopeptidase, partial [Mangrovibacterium sp.]
MKFIKQNTKLKGLTLIALLVIVSMANAQTGKVYPKTGIVKGVLDNGFTYYLMQNPVSPGKVNYYLMQDVGAILEEDSQNGLAHFLEHMAFNGTKNFPDDAILKSFEKRGLKSSINAHTGVDQTVYHFTNIPTKDHAFNDQCLLMLYDWCDNLTLDQDKIDSERLVILEEKRTRNNLDFRVKMASYEAMFNDSKYAHRNIIGIDEILKNFKREELVNFYHKWYRSDLQAIVVVGDFNLYETEKKIKTLFSQLPKVENPAERYHIIIPDNKEILYKQVRDKECKDASVNINVRHDFHNTQDENNLALLINQMMSARTRALLKKDTTDLKAVNIAFAPIAYGYGQYAMSVVYKKGRANEGLKAVLDMQKDILENGFTEEEFDAAKDRFLKYLRRNVKAGGRMTNAQYFESIKKNYINKIDILDAASDLKEFQAVMKNLTLENIQDKMNELYNGKNKSIIAIGGLQDKLMTKEEVLEIDKNSVPVKILPDKNNKEKEPATEAETAISNVKLIENDADLITSPIDKIKKLGDFQAEIWTLENGATVVYKECNLNKNLVNVYAASYGGTSQLGGDALLNGMLFSQFTSAFGVEGMSSEELKSALKTANTNSSLKLSNISEELFFASDYANVETMFQLLYCRFEKPAFYEDKFNEIYKKFSEGLKNKPKTYQKSLGDSIKYLKYGKERYIPVSESSLENVSLQKLEKVYRDRYKDASNFTFYIVGGISKARAKKLAEKYIGSISSIHSNESFKNYESGLASGRVDKTFKFEMAEKKAGIIYTMSSKEEYSSKVSLTVNILTSYLSDKLQKVIRDMEKGTYGVFVKPISKPIAESSNEMGFEISFDCNPERAVDLNNTLNETMDIIVDMGVLPADFELIKKKLRQQGNTRRDNMYYISAIKHYLNYKENID